MSNTLFVQSSLIPSARSLTAGVWQWGQFLDHDLSLTPSDASDPAPVMPPQPDPYGMTMIPFSRSLSHTDGSGVRQHVNEITSYIDASMVYGSDTTACAARCVSSAVAAFAPAAGACSCRPTAWRGSVRSTTTTEPGRADAVRRRRHPRQRADRPDGDAHPVRSRTQPARRPTRIGERRLGRRAASIRRPGRSSALRSRRSPTTSFCRRCWGRTPRRPSAYGYDSQGRRHYRDGVLYRGLPFWATACSTRS